MVIAGNLLGPTTFGVFANATTYLMVISILSTFGIDLWLARHVANETLTWRAFAGILGWRLVLSSLSIGVFVVLLNFKIVGDALAGHKWSVTLILASVFLDHISMTANAVLEGRKKLSSCALLSLTRWGSFALFAIAFLMFKPVLFSLASGLLLASCIRAVFSLIIVRPLMQESGRVISMTWVLKQATPMAILNFMIVLYFHIDMLMLPEMVATEQTGWYKMAYTLVEALLFVSSGIAAALFPLFSKEALSMAEKVRHLEKGMKILCVAAFPIAWGTPLVAEQIIKLIFPAQWPAFQPSADSLSILIWSLPFMFMNATLVRFFLGIYQANKALWLVSLTAVLNIGLNFYSIPHWGHIGAAVATVISEGLLCFAMIFVIKRDTPSFRPIPAVVPAFLLAALVCPVGLLTNQTVPLLTIPAAAGTYGLALWAFRLVDRSWLSSFAKEEKFD